MAHPRNRPIEVTPGIPGWRYHKEDASKKLHMTFTKAILSSAKIEAKSVVLGEDTRNVCERSKFLTNIYAEPLKNIFITLLTQIRSSVCM